MRECGDRSDGEGEGERGVCSGGSDDSDSALTRLTGVAGAGSASTKLALLMVSWLAFLLKREIGGQCVKEKTKTGSSFDAIRGREETHIIPRMIR